jgi:DNA-binding phage protein
MSNDTVIGNWQKDFFPTEEGYLREVAELVAKSPYSLTELAARLHIGRTSLYRYLRDAPHPLIQRSILEGLRSLQ